MPKRSSAALWKPQNLPEIVDRILEELGNPNTPNIHRDVSRAIKRAFGFFGRWDRWFARAGKATLADKAKEIAEHIAVLETKLRALPAPLRDFLFTPTWARGAIMPDRIRSVRKTYMVEMLEPLRRMRLDCETFLTDAKKEMQQQPVHAGPEIDRVQRHCAELAHDLMQAFSKRRITGSVDGPYHCIASLLFEALSGRSDVNLKRHCDFVRNARLKSPLHSHPGTG
jgi:hypothetical protein